ncbi:MAG: LPS export ABC transporter periplasmic protein LptC [Pseudomonadota bacterium]
MKHLALALAAAVAVLALLLFWDQVPDLFGGRDQAGAPQLPAADSYMNATLTRKFDRQGRLAYRLTATQSAYFEVRDQAVLTAPRLWAEPDQQDGPWHLKANAGVLHNADRRVELRDEVMVWRDTPQGKSELSTSKLDYYPDTARAQTDQPVTLRSGSSITNAVGLDADLERQTYRLLSRVHSVHQPQ